MGSYWSKDAAQVAESKEFITGLVTEHPVVIFSKTNCWFCASAKSEVGFVGSQVDNWQGAHIVELNKVPNGYSIQQALAEMTGRTTVPNVFIDGHPVGGGEEIESLRRNGTLYKLLENAMSPYKIVI